LGDRFQQKKNPKPPSFQIGSGQNLAGLFFKQICINSQSDIQFHVIISTWWPQCHFTQKSATAW